jgi:hypothetical protein
VWQQFIVGLIVLAAAVYAARSLGPRRWRRRSATASSSAGAAAGSTTGGQCGCGKDEGGCH